MTNDLPQLDVFYGDLTANRAFVYARLPRRADDSGLTLTGQIRGPRCLHAQTLPSVAPLIDLGPGPTLLARALIPEPCFWSPDLPAIYDVVVNLQRGTEIVATARREIGLRSLGIRAQNFVLEGKRWIMRGVCAKSATDTLPRAWHDAAAAYVCPSANDDRLAEASQWGALAVVEISGTSDEIIAQLRQLALHPAAALAVIHGDLPRDFGQSARAPNLLLAQPWNPRDNFTPQPWAHAIWADAFATKPLSDLSSSTTLPIIAVRPLPSSLPLDQARSACDQLQRDLAPIGQFAGYIV
jgi:hypothetical protein